MQERKELPDTLHELLQAAIDATKTILSEDPRVSLNLDVWTLINNTANSQINLVGGLLAMFMNEPENYVIVLDSKVIDKLRAIQEVLDCNILKAWKILYNETNVTEENHPVYQAHSLLSTPPEYRGDNDAYFKALERSVEILKGFNL